MKKILTLNSHLDNSYYLTGDSKNEIYLYVELKAAEAKKEVERIPLNISIVIDRSGSMHGAKLEYVKKATDFVIDNLSKEDVMSIVQYDDRVDIVSKSQPILDKKALHDKVAKIESRGMTNLSGGMMEGYGQVKSTKKEGYVNRTLLLSDGLANVGITDPEKLQEIARRQFRDNGIGLSTFGVGEGFNELLMTSLAEHGGANYYFIEAPDQIPQIFAEELKGLLSVVAQNTKLKINFPSAYLQCEKVYGYLHQQSGDTISIDFNDVFSEEEKAIVIKFTTRRAIDRDLDFLIDLAYDDVMETMDKVQEAQTTTLALTNSERRYESGLNRQALENVALFVSNDMFERVMKLADQRDYTKAQTLGAQVVTYLETHVKMFPTSEQLKNQLEQVRTYVNGLPQLEKMQRENQVAYSMAQKTSRSVNYKLSKKKF